MLWINQGLKCIYINVSNHRIEAQELEAFTEYMQEEDIEVQMGLPEITACHTVDDDILCSEDNEGLLVITDSDESVAELDVAVVGYGAEYQGTASYVIESLDVWVSYLRMAYARYMELPFVVAETDRLIIREMTLDDLSQMYELYESIKGCPYVEPLYEWNEEYEFCARYIENMYTFFGHGLWLVFEKETGELIGRAGIENRVIDGETCRELGYLIRKDKQGKGYAIEALEAILNYAVYDLSLGKMFICTHKDNEKSIAVARKLGFEDYAIDVDGMNIYSKVLEEG